MSGCAPGCLVLIPLIGALFADRGPTYYQIDTALMFQEIVRRAVLEVIDDLTKAQGLRALSESERKPILREFYGR